MAINTIFSDFSYEILPKLKETWDKYCKIIQWGRRHPTRFVEDFIGIQLTDYQKYIFMNCWTAGTAVILCSRATGKATSLDTKVYLKNKSGCPHYSTVGELKVGDKIYDSQGKLSEVIHLNPIIFDDYYIVEFDDGEKIKCNGEHLWLVYDKNFHKKGQTLDDCRLLNTDYIYNNFNRGKNYSSGDNDYTFYIPINKPIEYTKGDNRLTIDPYVLGYYLGSGNTTSGIITCGIEDIEDTVNNLKQCSTTVTYRKDVYKENIYVIKVDFEKDLYKSGYNNCKNRSLKQKLTDCEDLLHNKHIPEKYLFTSVENRLALLQGIMDSDGFCDLKGKCEFIQTNKKIAEDVCWLIRSLGMKAILTHKTHTGHIKKNETESDTWRVYFAPSKEMPVFRLKRKKDKLPEHPTTVATRKAIVNVTHVADKIPMRCITMRNEDGTFLCGENFTVTHNSFFSAPFIMTRSLLIPNHKTYIMSVSGGQASATFSKMEDLANNNIASVIGVSSVFLENVIRPNSKTSGFSHGKEGMHVELFNGSEVTSLNSVPENLRGARSNLNVYD